MKRITTILLMIFMISQGFSQNQLSKNGFTIPGTLEECVSQLDKTFEKKAKTRFASLDESQLRKVSSIYLLNEWAENDSTAFVTYFQDRGINNDFGKEREYLTLLAFHRFLHAKPVNIDAEVRSIKAKNDSLKFIKEQRYRSLASSDTFNTMYIPKDIRECMSVLDQVTSSEVKEELKRSRQSDVELLFQPTLGRWMNSSWNLRDGSRIHHYLVGKGIDHADGMTGFLLRAYHHYLSAPQPDYDQLLNAYLPEYKKMKDLIRANERQLADSYVHSEDYKQFLKKRKISDFMVYKY